MRDKNSAQTENVMDQVVSGLTFFVKSSREAASESLVAAQQQRFEEACTYIETVRAFISRPGEILGSEATKHGEVAEVAEVGVRIAKAVLRSEPVNVNSHPLRTGPVDYQVDGADVQSKFLNGLHNTLRAVTGHAKTYPEFVDGNSYYAIPKDQYELLQRFLGGDHEGMSSKTINALKKLTAELEQQTGRTTDDLVRSANFTYKDVQLGAIDETLDRTEADLTSESESIEQDIRNQHTPSLQEGLKVAGIAAGVGAGVAFVRSAFKKHQEGRNLFKGEFTAEDWKDVGLDTGKGALIGGVTGGSLYFLTNCAQMSAPMAGAMVSAVKGVAPLVEGYRNGSLSMEQLIDSSCMVFAEVGMVAAATAVGQAVIPVPLLGALIGSIAGQALASVLAKQVEGAEAAIHARLAIFRAALSSKQQIELDQIKARFERMGDLTEAAFDVQLNADILYASASLARAYGVSQEKLLLTVEDVDRFVLA